jgi:aryl-alcohol dehydrogenase-like predicted oxidoreductase
MIEHQRFVAVNGAEPEENADPMLMVECLPEVSVPIASLVPGFHLRASGVDASHIQLLADAAGSVRLPSILVQKHGTRIIDGMHRIEVARLRGEWSIKARIVDCTDEEALILAVRSNTLHGLPLSKADRISGAKRILAVYPDWSDRAVAGITGLGAKAIASLRNSSTIPQMHVKRLGRDGKRRPMVPGEGRIRAAEYIEAHPDASVRQVARESDVSVGTAQKVREGLRNGMVYVPHDRAAGSTTAGSTTAADTPAGHRVSDVRDPRRSLAWQAVAPKLTSDPALRYTEGGRAFLRWMGAHSMGADEWREFADAVPAHWLDDVLGIALGMGEEWRQFADWIKCRRETAGLLDKKLEGRQVEYRTLSGTDLRVSRLCLGGWQIGGMAFGYVPDEDVRKILFTALDLGINFFDMAPSYGRNRAEELVGSLLPASEDVVVASKVGLRWGPDLAIRHDLTPQSIREEVEMSLRRLRRETIDLYLVHWPDPETPLDVTFGTLEQLRTEGKFRHLGVCNYTQPELADLREYGNVVALQSRYNLLEREYAADIEFCRDNQMSFIAHSSLATGLLTGKYDSEVRFEDARDRFDMFKGEGLRRALAQIATLKAEAAAHGTTLLSMALQFILGTPGADVAIIGTRSAEQLQGAVMAVYS